MYFDENNNYFNDYNNKSNSFEIEVGNINFFRSDDFFSYEEGFNKGNIFKNIYSKYKNHVYNLKVNNSKDRLLYEIQMYTFVLKDLNLYLDIYQNDQKKLSEFKKVSNLLNNKKEEYESNYGVLYAKNNNSDYWSWINNPWPWDKGGLKNV